MELAILSPDNFPLLDKMRKELIEVGYVYEDLGAIDSLMCLRIYPDKSMAIWNHELTCENITLTPDNYNQILTRCITAINK